MSNEQSIRVNDVSKAVDDLFLHFGVWTTFKTMVVVAWQHRHARQHVSHLSDHLRRDIGLPVNKPLLGKPLIPPWHPRF